MLHCPPDYTQLKKIILQEYILTITHKRVFSLFHCFLSSVKSLPEVQGPSHWRRKKGMRQKQERDWKRRREEQPWRSRTGNGSVSSRSHPNPSVSPCLAAGFGPHGHPWAGSSQGCWAQHWEHAGNKTSTRHPKSGLRWSSCTYGLIQGWAGEEGEEMSCLQLPISC